MSASSSSSYAELFPDLPTSLFGVNVPGTAQAIANAASPATNAAFDALPDDAQSSLQKFWSDEINSGFTLITGNAEYELALAVVVFLWATGRPGFFAGAFDAYVATPIDKVISEKKFDVQEVRLGGQIRRWKFRASIQRHGSQHRRRPRHQASQSRVRRDAASKRRGVHEPADPKSTAGSSGVC